MRKPIAATVLLLALLMTSGCGTAINLLDRGVHRSSVKGPGQPSDAALKLHNRLEVVDLHADSLLWDRALLTRCTKGHVDLFRLRQGNVALQVFAAVTAVPFNWDLAGSKDKQDVIPLIDKGHKWRQQPEWPHPADEGWYNDKRIEAPMRLQYAVYQARKLKSFVANSDHLRLILTRNDLDELLEQRRQGQPVLGVLMALEGAHALGDGLKKELYERNLEILFEEGFRMFGLCHAFDNAFAGASLGMNKYGLTEAGKDVVKKAIEMSMAIDLAHASDQAILDACDIAIKKMVPVIASHTGVKRTCDTNRNLGPAQVQAIADTGGVIGIGLFKDATCEKSLAATTRAMRYVIAHAGASHVALGSDFDGFVSTPVDAAGLALLTQALMERYCINEWQTGSGNCDKNCMKCDFLSEDEIKMAMGGNAIEVLRRVLPVRTEQGSKDE